MRTAARPEPASTHAKEQELSVAGFVRRAVLKENESLAAEVEQLTEQLADAFRRCGLLGHEFRGAQGRGPAPAGAAAGPRRRWRSGRLAAGRPVERR